MLIFKLTLTISGDKFFPSKVIHFVNKKYVHESCRDAEDSNHGVIYFMHPQLFGRQGEGISYEEWFVKLLEENFEVFRKYGAEDIDLFMEIYYSGDQCNFEVFDRKMLKRISNFNVAIPISIYHLSDNEIFQLLD